MSTMALAHCGPTSTKSAIRCWLAVWLLGLLLLLAVVFVLRRIAGGLTAPLSGSALAACGLALAAASIAIRLLQPGGAQASEFSRSAWRAAPAVATVLIASSLSIPGTPAGGLCALWMLAALGELAGQLICQVRLERILQATIVGNTPSARLSNSLPSSNIAPEAFYDESMISDGGEISQHCIRRTDVKGRELLSGWLRIDISPGERTRFAHVAFCPPLLNSPHCEIELDHDQATATVAQVLPQGARFELKLPKPATEPTSIALEWVAYETGEK